MYNLNKEELKGREGAIWNLCFFKQCSQRGWIYTIFRFKYAFGLPTLFRL